ncbi:HepT-like ribonuclease domain-containing protein [Cellulomonas hominis]|uniref:HepT-like ribonuclease domain-containing protein n=1 Tax=Cellulomonas hominis TaxID=156981 RepID=UPI001B9258B9|nr:HepT-like ribonuclease domain-containing protein [Cellulomonas hominis]VTR77141.1 hypothetical protein CHMI_01909 [Cellulomonas hominis]
MTPEQAERVVALVEELDAAAALAGDEQELRADWRLRLAAERVVERIFLAATDLDAPRAERYFGREGMHRLRGMRNRLAHNYLAVDQSVLWSALSVQVPAVRAAVGPDLAVARAVLADATGSEGDPDRWRSTHLRPIDPA